jgi:hypothetical protein
MTSEISHKIFSVHVEERVIPTEVEGRLSEINKAFPEIGQLALVAIKAFEDSLASSPDARKEIEMVTHITVKEESVLKDDAGDKIPCAFTYMCRKIEGFATFHLTMNMSLLTKEEVLWKGGFPIVEVVEGGCHWQVVRQDVVFKMVTPTLCRKGV